jgi:hypothetical protein
MVPSTQSPARCIKSPDDLLVQGWPPGSLFLLRLIATRIRIIRRCTRGRFAPAPALWKASFSYSPVRAMAARKCLKCPQLFREFRARALFVRGVLHPYFSVGPSRQREALVCCLDGLAILEYHGAFSRWRRRLLRRNRAGFEPQRASPFVKRVKGPQILGEAAGA